MERPPVFLQSDGSCLSTIVLIISLIILKHANHNTKTTNMKAFFLKSWPSNISASVAYLRVFTVFFSDVVENTLFINQARGRAGRRSTQGFDKTESNTDTKKSRADISDICLVYPYKFEKSLITRLFYSKIGDTKILIFSRSNTRASNKVFWLAKFCCVIERFSLECRK